MHRLVEIRGPNPGKAHAVKGDCILGRASDSDIYISDLNVSRQHARVCIGEGGSVIIEDLGSGNGTFVNGRQITRCALAPDDVIGIGGCTLRYESVPDPPARPARWLPEVLTMMADPVAEAALGLHGPDFDPNQTLKSDTAAGGGKTEERAPEIPVGSGLLKVGSELSGASVQRMLEAMYAVADVIATELDPKGLLDKILDHLFRVFPQTERGFVMLVSPETGQLIPEAVKRRHKSYGSGLRFSQTIIRDVMDQGRGVIRGQESPNAGWAEGGPLAGVGTLSEAPGAAKGEPKIGAPMTCRGETLGTIHLEGRPGSRDFSDEDLALLSAIACQAALAIANARAGQVLLRQQRMEADLTLAREIQKSFLPHRLPSVRGLRFETYYSPALQVGGDFYDIIKLDGNRLAIVLGDISGKGVSAALMMAKMITDIRLLAISQVRPGPVLTRANDALLEMGRDEMFATVIYLLLDLDRQSLSLANAGHQPPLVCGPESQGVRELEEGTEVALGVLPGTEYPEITYSLRPGEVVLLYTDGINEAQTRSSQLYGTDRLCTVVASSPRDPAQLIGRVISDVRRFVGGAAQSDDQTLVAFGIPPGE